MINPHIFREYDIRGRVDIDLSPATAELLGRAIGTALVRSGGRRFVVARDNRLSSPAYHDGMTKGLVAAGVEVLDIGMVPTPLMYYALHHLEPDGGVIVTGSHNPPDFNGFKIAIGKSTIWGEKIQEIRRLIEEEDFETGAGSVSDHDIITPYREMILSKISLERPLRIAVDAGSGAGGPIAPSIFRELGCEVTELYCQPDGTYPGHFPDPTIPANLEELKEAVLAEGLDFGVAYDGDADRIGVIDNGGGILWGDQLMMLYSREILRRGPASIIFEVKCSQNLDRDIAARGGRPIMWKTGHSLIKKKMKEEGAALGGEMSGHIFFADEFFGFDDAIYASARLMRIVAASETPLSAMLADVPPTFATPEIRIECPDGKKFDVVREVTDKFRASYDVIDVDGVRVSYPDGWALLRASNTQPVLVVRFEAGSEERLAEIKDEMFRELKGYGFVTIPKGL